MIGTKKIGGVRVIVIGGGTSGLMARSARMHGAEVVRLRKIQHLERSYTRVERATVTNCRTL